MTRSVNFVGALAMAAAGLAVANPRLVGVSQWGDDDARDIPRHPERTYSPWILDEMRKEDDQRRERAKAAKAEADRLAAIRLAAAQAKRTRRALKKMKEATK